MHVLSLKVTVGNFHLTDAGKFPNTIKGKFLIDKTSQSIQLFFEKFLGGKIRQGV